MAGKPGEPPAKRHSLVKDHLTGHVETLLCTGKVQPRESLFNTRSLKKKLHKWLFAPLAQS